MLEVKSYKSPTQLVLDQFKKKKDKALNAIKEYLTIMGYMGDEIISEINQEQVPETIANLLKKIQTGNVLEVLDALNNLNLEEANDLSDKQIKLFNKIPSQTITRRESGYEYVKFLFETNWRKPKKEELIHLRRILEPLKEGTKETVRELKERYKPHLAILKQLPKFTPIDYENNKTYGKFLMAIVNKNLEETLEIAKILKPVSINIELS